METVLQSGMSNTEFKTYTVTLRFQFPAHDERDGLTYQEDARNKAEAISSARTRARNDGHTGVGGKGRVTFTAKETDPCLA